MGLVDVCDTFTPVVWCRIWIIDTLNLKKCLIRVLSMNGSSETKEYSLNPKPLNY
jgi:hypothetical protein